MRSPDTTPSTASDLPGALCPQTDPEIFFPERGASPKEAKNVCAACEARAECLALALSLGNVMGVWGGLTQLERRHLKRTSPAMTKPICRGCGKRFTAHGPRAVYCGDLCRHTARRATKAASQARQIRKAA